MARHFHLRLVAVGAPLVLALAALATQACSSDAGPAASPPSSLPGAPNGQTHAIRVLVKQPDGSTSLLKLGPATEAHFGAAATSGSTLLPFDVDSSAPLASQGNPGLHILGVNDEGGAGVQPPPTVDNPGTQPWSTAWALVWRAAAQCDALRSFDFQYEIPPWRTPEKGPGSTAPWYIYPAYQISSCADRLAIEQNLLCVADKLASVADAVGTVVWPNASGVAGPSFTYGPDAGAAASLAEWDIPPQADGDRFIVRDLAIHTLAMIPALDAYTDMTFPSEMPQHATCAQAFAWLANPTNTGPGCISLPVMDATFGGGSSANWTPRFPPSNLPICDAAGHNNAPAIAETAIEIEAQIMRASGRLLHDAIRRDVYSDLAAAARSSAQTLDPKVGNEVAWGVSDQGPYGTIAHAARVLVGRWELGDQTDFGNVADPQCESTREIDLLPNAFGDALSARYLDRAIRTPGEQTAAQLVERSGIVVPACALGNASSLRNALIAQLLLEEKNINGVAPPSAAIKSIVDALSDEELTFAFERALRTWRLLTDSPDAADGGAATQDGGPSACAPVAQGTGPNGTDLPAGLSLALDAARKPAIAKEVNDVSGIAVQGGLPRSRLKSDPIARSSGMMEASQCDQASLYWSEWGVDGTAIFAHNQNLSSDGLAQPPGAALPPVVFQDAFHVGQALERRLNLLQQAASGLADGNAAAVARGGIAELRNWAGATIVQAWPVPNASDHTVSTFTVRVGGMSYANDFAMADTTDMTPVANALGFVYGPPWVAECAAHVRAECPDGFDQTYVQVAKPADVVDVTGDPANKASGVLGNVFELHVKLSNGQMFNPPHDGTSTPQRFHLYMVRLHEPKDPSGHGRVLGTLPLSGNWTNIVPGGGSRWQWDSAIVGFVDAPMQRELLHDAIDLGKWVGAKPPALGDPSAAQTSGYCVDGVPADIFVPLDNELASSSAPYEDSWQHYLDLAQEAAQTADALGQQLIADDLQISERQQAAQEQLANICGDFGALSGAAVGNDGTVTGAVDDKTTQECLSEPTIDVVFLGDLPDGVPESGNQTCAVKAAINCASQYMTGCNNAPAQASTPPSAVQLCEKPTLTAAALHIVPPTTNTSSIPGCWDLYDGTARTLRTGLKALRLQGDLEDPALAPSELEDTVSKLKMTVDFRNQWQVSYGAQTIMDSADAAYWPACLAPGNGKCSNVSAAQQLLAPTFSAVFRHCADSSADLGCNGDGGRDAQRAELNMIKWRVMQSMWMLGVSAGIVPQGMVRQPIPGVFGDDWLNAGDDTYFPTGALTFYPGRLRSPSDANWCPQGTPCQMLDPNDGAAHDSIADTAAIGPVVAVDDAFRQFEPAAGGEMPYWFRMLYSSAYQDKVKHFMAANDAVVADHCGSIDGPFSTGGCPSGGLSPTPVALAAVLGRANNLDGALCDGSYGEPRGRAPAEDGAAAQPWWVTVQEAKVGFGNLFFLPSGGSQANFWAKAPDVTNWDLSNSAAIQPGTGVSSVWTPGLGPIVRPTDVSPSQRAISFSGYGAGPSGTCGGAALLVQSAAMACAPLITGAQSGARLDTVPSVASLSDVPKLIQWLDDAQTAMKAATGRFYVQEVPKRVVDDLANKTVGSGALGGSKGQAVLAMEQQMQAFPSAWTQLANDVESIRNAIRVAELAVTAANLSDRNAEAGVALQTIQVQARMTESVHQLMASTAIAAATAVPTGGASLLAIPSAAVTAADTSSAGNQEIGTLQDIANDAEKTEQNQVALALAQLDQTTGPLWSDVQKQIDNLRGAAAQVDASGQMILQSEHEAAYQAAIGTGADFVNIAGQEVPIPVNTVLRRQASATERRYQEALKNAKALAYMARRGIEQRIGAPLSVFKRQVGPLDPPASWADDICSLQGVNYASLSTAVAANDAGGGGGIGGAADKQAISQFADAWVGDYVSKLRNFVTYYNAQYPSHQGNDTAVLSLRYDLLGTAIHCTVQGANLLTNSGDLSHFGSGTWDVTPCDPTAAKCLAVVGGYGLADHHDGPFGSQGASGDDATGISWLVDVPGGGGNAGVSDGGPNDAGISGVEAGTVARSGAPNSVLQRVKLPAGSYVLSWWDQARQADGTLAWANGTPPPPDVPYVVQVLDGSSSVVAIYNDKPYAPPKAGDGGAPPSSWSPRRTLSFVVPAAGDYTVTFAASAPGDGMGSTAIAAVQLEQAVDGQPTDYVPTNDSTFVSGTSCPLADADLRAAFAHNCDGSGACYYDLSVPLIIDTTDIGAGSPLGAKLASGNYNYRHITAAVNLVGTGIHDCSKTPDPNCYGTGYIQYDLQHDASSAGIIGFDGNARIFDFGAATINHGKALAAERYLTVPLSSSDQALVSQPGIQHVELGGRPLDGTYHLRIWDSPALNWSALKDVQIILNYEYWSAIGVSQTQARVHTAERVRTPLILGRRVAPSR